MYKHYAYSILVVVLSAATGAAAQPTTPEQFGTPDNLPPPMEDICDMTTGAANGLCVAYCEAMDCDSDYPNAGHKACTKVSDNFIKLTGEIPPCDRVCPCWEEDALENVTAANQSQFSSCPGIDIPYLIQNSEISNGVEGGFAADPAGEVFGDPVCLTRDLSPFILIVDEAQAQYCADQISDRCAAIGTPIP